MTARLRILTLQALLAAALFASAGAHALEWAPHESSEAEVYPGAHWAKVTDPTRHGWSKDLLARAREYSDQIGSTAVMIVQNGIVIDAWGQIATKSNLHSGRKSLLSGLIGIEVDRGNIDLRKSLDDLGIDDSEPSLTPKEKTASVGDLIRARSGIYHPALYETRRMTESKPERGSNNPGDFWHYNNWDFNALGTIYEQESGKTIFEAFMQEFALPLQMEDFEITDGEYVRGSKSIHPAYPFRMTARDFARFALLYLRNGRWEDRQILSENWVRESTRTHSIVGPRAGYGYMWWTAENYGMFYDVWLPEPVYYASGWGRQLAIVMPHLDLVIIHRVNTDQRSEAQHPRWSEVGKLVWLILAAAGSTDHGPEPRF